MLLPIKNKYYCPFPTNIIAQFLPILLPSSENASSIWCICLLESTETCLIIDVFAYWKVMKCLEKYQKCFYYLKEIPIAKYWNGYDDMKNKITISHSVTKLKLRSWNPNQHKYEYTTHPPQIKPPNKQRATESKMPKSPT